MPKDQWNGKITGYSIQVEGPDTTRNIPITGEYATFKELFDLKPSTEYSFSVSAETVAGIGPAINVSFIIPQEGEASMHTSSLNSN
ncbi:MAG: fibronectin type III domain-containing protein [Proteobacteria bacterium]|nr:fibronectin type III domain-containing protein [Pseudomonadota bacterium]